MNEIKSKNKHNISNNIVKETFKSVLIAQLLSFLSQIISMVVDGAITGKCLGADNLTAYGFAGSVVSIIVAFAGFAMTGISIVCARSIGGSKEEERTSIFSTSMIFSVIMGIVIMAATLLFSKTWAGLAGARGDIILLTSEYLIGFGIGIVPCVMVSSIFPIMQLDGDKKRMMIAFLAMSVSDIILDLLNGYVLHGGIFGMGLATSISSVVGFVILLMHFKGNNHMFHFKISSFKMKYVVEIFVFGYMYIVKQLLITALIFIFNNYLMKKYNADMVAVYTAISSAGSICLCVGMAMGSTVSVLTSVYAGEKDGGTIRKMMKVSFQYSVIINAVVVIVVMIVARPLVGAYFKKGGELLDAAVTGFRIYSLVMIIRSINLCIRGYYQSMKMQKLTFCFSFLQTFLCTAICMFVLDRWMGINGVWLSFAAGEFVALVLLVTILMIAAKGKKGIDIILRLPDDYETEELSIMEGSFDSMDAIVEYSEKLRVFCNSNGADAFTANHISLAIEEIAGNVIKHGFIDNKRHTIDIRVTKNEDNWFVRIRDDCANFNPVLYAQEHTETSVEHIGINLINKQAKDVQYMNTLNLNNLIITL